MPIGRIHWKAYITDGYLLFWIFFKDICLTFCVDFRWHIEYSYVFFVLLNQVFEQSLQTLVDYDAQVYHHNKYSNSNQDETNELLVFYLRDPIGENGHAQRSIENEIFVEYFTVVLLPYMIRSDSCHIYAHEQIHIENGKDLQELVFTNIGVKHQLDENASAHYIQKVVQYCIASPISESIIEAAVVSFRIWRIKSFD